MDFNFVCPRVNSDLLNSDGNNYFVKQVYDAKDLLNLLKDAKNAFNLSDPFYIFDHFDTFFSLIENAGSVQMGTLLKGCDLLYVTADKLGQLLSTYLTGNEMTDRNSHLNLIKMIMFLIVGLVKAMDHLCSSEDGAGVKKGARKQNAGEYDSEWDGKRFQFLLQIFNILQLPIEKLWRESIADEQFINMICEIGYRTLESPSIKEKRVSDTIFQIFGTAIKRYNHAMTFPVRILQILRTCEIAVEPIAHGIHLLHDEYDIKKIFSILLTDIIESLSVDAADTQTTRNCSQFLLELGRAAPKEIMPHLSALGEELLDLEAYVIRNSVLEVMGNVVTLELATEELSDELKEIRDIFLEDLLNHIMDINAHVRSKVLQIWNHMKNENAVPLIFQNKVLQLASERLDDKATLVRKHSVLLIKAFLETNPFAAKLSLEELKVNLEKEVDKLQEIRNKMIDVEKSGVELHKKWEDMVPELTVVVQEMLSQSTQNDQPTDQYENNSNRVQEIATLILEKDFRQVVKLVKEGDSLAGNREARISLTYDQQCAYYLQLIKSYLFLNQNDYAEEFTTQDQTVKFLKDSIEFSEIIAQSVPKIENMLMSKVNTDVFEAIDFFTTAYLFGIKGTQCGMRKMLYLVWSGDKEKRDAVTKAYNRVLFGTDQTGRPHAIKVVDNLCSFFEDITIGHYAAMEVLMQEWIENNDIDNQIIQVLFERFSLKLPDTSKNKARLAFQLLCMASSGKQSIATANIDVVQSICFEERGLQDPRLFASSLAFLSNLAPSNKSAKYYKRYDATNPLIEKVIETFKKLFFVPNLKDFDSVASNTFDFIYRVCQSPDLTCQNLLLDICQELRDITLRAPGATEETNNNNNFTLPNCLWTKIIYVFGYSAMKEMIFLDIDVYNNMKYRQDLMEEKKNQKKSNKRKTNTTNLNMSASNALKRLSGSAAEPQQEPDEMLVGATAEDNIAELVNHICENELLFTANAIFPKIIPILMEILKQPSKFNDQKMQQAACLTFIRFMSVSAKFCENNMQFLMGILSATKNTIIKCNIVIGLSDLTFRFPNIIEPWTHHFYSTLHEENVEIRLTAVKVISHLILHEMIRVKGQISDLALCIVDENDEIRNITQQFFKEIANKSNILYNVLPDIISRLSSTEIQIEEEKYHVIMKHIIGLIQKDRQVESLVEKLCLRFRVTNEERQWRDIAFCLSLLNYTEKTIRKLIDNIQCFKDKLQEDQVHECFKTIISNTSKLAKPELKAIVTDFEAKINECLSVNPEETDENNSQSQKRRSFIDMPPPKKIPKRGRKIQVIKKKSGRVLDDSDSDSDFDQPQNVTNVRSSARKKKPVAQVAPDESSSDSSSDEEIQQSNKRGRRIKQKK